jgi:WD40 repeat protein
MNIPEVYQYCYRLNLSPFLHLLKPSKSLVTFTGHKSFVYSLAVHPINNLIMSGGYDGTIQFFDAVSGGVAMKFHGHADPITSVDVSPSGIEFVSGGNDGIIRLWDARFSSVCRHTINNPITPTPM